MITELEAREMLGVDGAATLVEVVDQAWRQHLAEGVRRWPATRANVVWDHMIAGADRLFEPRSDVRRVVVHGRPVYVVRERMAVRFKKHNRELATSNVATEAQAVLGSQGSFDVMPDVPHVSCGYVLDDAEAEVRRIVLVRTVGGVVEWYIDLPDLASGNLQPVRPILPQPTLPSLPKIARPAADTSRKVE